MFAPFFAFGKGFQTSTGLRAPTNLNTALSRPIFAWRTCVHLWCIFIAVSICIESDSSSDSSTGFYAAFVNGWLKPQEVLVAAQKRTHLNLREIQKKKKLWRCQTYDLELQNYNFEICSITRMFENNVEYTVTVLNIGFLWNFISI